MKVAKKYDEFGHLLEPISKDNRENMLEEFSNKRRRKVQKQNKAQKRESKLNDILLNSYFDDITQHVNEENGNIESLLFTSKCILSSPVSKVHHKKERMRNLKRE